MAAIAQIKTAPQPDSTDSMQVIVACERLKSLMLRAWILAGIFFMALPGTLLGFSNLMAISTHHGLGALPAAWIQGHGHAQVFGWIGSFVLGIGFYSQPSHGRSVIRIPLTTSFALWTAGGAMRWTASIYGWHWRSVFPISAGFELIAVLLFIAAASQHKLPERAQSKRAKPRMELWMVSVLMGTAGLAALVIFNFVECLRLAINGTLPAFPHALDQKYLVLLAWGFLDASGLGVFRTLAAYLPRDCPAQRASILHRVVPGPDRRSLRRLWLDHRGDDFAHLRLSHNRARIASDSASSPGPAKVQGIHPSFPSFIRLAYAWLLIAGSMSLVWAALADQHGGIWGASRHALTVGFAATMVFAIGPRILPHFAAESTADLQQATDVYESHASADRMHSSRLV